MGDYLDELPTSWIVSSLGEICSQPQYGYTTSSASKGNLRLLRTTDITSGDIDWESVPFCSENPIEETKYLLEDGDVVISRAGSVGVSYLLNKPLRSVFASYLIRFKPLLNRWYFKYFLESPFYWREIADNKLGIAVPNVNASKLKEIAIPISPGNEQHRIVAKIEELFSELDKGIENLKTAQTQLKIYRQALLKHAFKGKLTAQWRADHPDKLETADALLKRIQQERTQRYQQQLADWEAAGKQGGKPKAPKIFPSLTADEFAVLPELPDGWCWVRVGDVGSVGTGVTPLKGRPDFYANGNIPWITSGALNDNFVTEPSDYVTQVALKKTNLRMYPRHTLLVALYGEGKTRGKCSELLIEATTNQAIAAIVQEGLSEKIRKYLKWFFQKNYEDIRLKSSGGVQPNLNLSVIENTLFPMCSITEVDGIVDAIEAKWSEADQLDQTLTTALQQAEALRQSILKKAFSGQLVPQDPNDEPAAVLLDRIRAARAASAKPITRKPRR